jgi:hypothetical protein
MTDEQFAELLSQFGPRVDADMFGLCPTCNPRTVT